MPFVERDDILSYAGAATSCNLRIPVRCQRETRTTTRNENELRENAAWPEPGAASGRMASRMGTRTTTTGRGNEDL